MNFNELIEKDIPKENADINKQVRYAQIKLLYKQTQISLIGVLLVSLTACVVFWEIIPHWKLSLWGGIIILLTAIRGITVVAFHKRKEENFDINKWANLHLIGIIVSGISWIIPFVFFWPNDHFLYQLAWPIFVIPMSTAAVATYYSWKPSYIFFLLLSALPISIRFFYEGGTLLIFLAILNLLFIMILLRAGNVMYEASESSFKTGIRNKMLNKDLKAEIAKSEALNKQLQQEIIERKLVEREIRKLSKVFLNGTNPIFIEDLKGNILEMNEEAVNVYGFTRDELVDKSVKLLVLDDDHNKMDDLIQQCINGKIVRDVECMNRRKDGSKIPVLMTLSLLTDENEKPFGIAFITSNLTEQKNIEMQLTKSKAAAESANATKDKFFKIISHDLKSPFTSILGFSDFLVAAYDSIDEMERKSQIQDINTSAHSAFKLLDNLLAWAQTQTNEIKISKEKVNLKELVTNSISNYIINADAKNIQIINEVEPELEINIDENTSSTFIRNIVNNAIKFTYEGGQITIHSKINEDSISLHIADTGVGMPQEVIDNLFRIDKGITTEGTNNEKGTGLGLILCKEFIERNGGSIDVKSELNKGSEFIINLPLESA